MDEIREEKKDREKNKSINCLLTNCLKNKLTMAEQHFID